MHASSIDGKRQFSIDVKGHSTRNFWDIREPKQRDNHYYVLVEMIVESPPKYYILSNQEMIDEWNEYYSSSEIKRKKEGKEISKKERWGIRYSQADKYENKWKTLN